jgi:hypothetical protein
MKSLTWVMLAKLTVPNFANRASNSFFAIIVLLDGFEFGLELVIRSP